MTVLTPEEEAEFTTLNLAAFSLLNEESDAIQPCWLCMSADAKLDARQRFVRWLQKKTGVLRDLEQTERYCDPGGLQPTSLQHQMAIWKENELIAKRARVDENNPHGFFAEYVKRA